MYFGHVFYKKILLIKITVTVYHPIGLYIGINPWDSPLAKYMTCGHVFCFGTDPLGLIPIVHWVSNIQSPVTKHGLGTSN